MTAKVPRQKKLREAAPAYLARPAPVMYQVTITSKGQVVIPAALRKKYNITPATRLLVSDEGGRIIIRPINAHELVEQLRGSLAEGPDLVKALLEERAQDREREDAKFVRFR
ncbi:MAG: AbrB/MazE/SpoVT family DNA-binding domain-containing protein [Anaerolineales bacterium]|nr:AbrB/MazE/SpoVT family DNA-binding domain-containing protein [Anaerolineales bacterium]